MIDFFRQVLIELRNITWLSRKQLVKSTVIVISISVAISVFLFLNDLIFAKVVFSVILKQ